MSQSPACERLRGKAAGTGRHRPMVGVPSTGLRHTECACYLRAGYSLMEVILAIAVLSGAIAILGEAARLTVRNVQVARDLTRAELLCESKMAEIVSGLVPPDPVQEAALEDVEPSETGWLYSIDTESLDDGGITAVHVTVRQNLPPEQRPVEFTLVRWIATPSESMTKGTD